MRGLFSLLPFATDAKESGTPTDAGTTIRTGRVRRRSFPMGWEERLACRRPTAVLAKGTYVNPRRNSGHASWDAV